MGIMTWLMGYFRCDRLNLSLRQAGIVWSLLSCLLFVNGFMAAPSVEHAPDHAHHQAGTHSSGFCAWLCTAGEGVGTALLSVGPAFQLVEESVYVLADQCECLAPHFVSLRGPPAF